MKRVIRKGVFETNSSSMHSIVITKKSIEGKGDEYDNFYLTKEGFLRIWGSDLWFGRSPFRILNTKLSKLEYAIALYLGYKRVKDPQTQKLIKQFNEMASRVFKDCKGIDFPIDDDRCCGEVDHESCILLDRFLTAENISLEEFITNPRYIVVIDGDEYCVLNDMKKSRLIKTDNIIKEYCDNEYAYDYVHEDDRKRDSFV